MIQFITVCILTGRLQFKVSGINAAEIIPANANTALTIHGVVLDDFP